MVNYLKLVNKEKFNILVSAARSKGLNVCQEYINNFSRYDTFTIDTSRDGRVNMHIWGQASHDDHHLLTFEAMLDLILDYKQENEYHLANRVTAVWKQGDEFVKINGDAVELSAIQNLITVINTLNQ